MRLFLQQCKLISASLILIFFISIESLSAQPPAGYYNAANGLNCSALKTALKNIITTGNTPKTYTDLWTQYQLTDIKPRTVGTGSSNVIYDIYSAKPGNVDPYQFTPGTGSGGQQDQGSGGTAEGQFYNREHSVPKSWYSGNTATAGVATDYQYVIPADKYVNGKRGDMPYAEVATASQTFLNGTKIGSSSVAGITGDASNKVFEPIDSFKGDVARSFLFFVTRYEDNMSTWPTNTTAAQAFAYNTFPSVTIPYLKLMIKWHKLDPVSERERTRNNGSYSFQGNRNPFIDRPELVDSVWNANCPGLSALPVDIIFFAGKLDGSLLNLTWEVGTEINVKQYEVEESLNGTSFKTIGIKEAQHLAKYSFAHSIEELRGRRLFYRIKKVDQDGKFAYSDVFTIHLPLNVKFDVYPNPVKNELVLRLNNNANAETQIEIIDVVGKTLLTKKATIENGMLRTNISSITNGTYFVKLNYKGEILTARIIVDK
jgi:endonuclease I